MTQSHGSVGVFISSTRHLDAYNHPFSGYYFCKEDVYQIFVFNLSIIYIRYYCDAIVALGWFSLPSLRIRG